MKAVLRMFYGTAAGMLLPAVRSHKGRMCVSPSEKVPGCAGIQTEHKKNALAMPIACRRRQVYLSISLL